jgi:hypothetical protein
LVEASFDAIALAIEGAVVFALDEPVTAGRNHHGGSHAADLGDDGARVVASVGDDSLGMAALEQWQGLRLLGRLTGRDAEGHRQTVFVGQQMDLRAQPTSGTPQSRVFAAPFLRPAAACWCARTIVESSIRYWFFLSFTRSAKMRSQMPDRAQRMNRACTLLYLP